MSRCDVDNTFWIIYVLNDNIKLLVWGQKASQLTK